MLYTRSDYSAIRIRHANEKAVVVVDKISLSTAVAILPNKEVRKFHTHTLVNLNEVELEYLGTLIDDERFELSRPYDLNEILNLKIYKMQ